jgi:carboxymethylenebutenolidase
MLTPIRIDNRINGFLGKPAGAGRRPALIHLHERYGIVPHTMDLGQKFVDAGYVTILPDLFSRFPGDREALARGDGRCELSDEEVLTDIDAVVTYLRTLPEVDSTKIAMSGMCQTGRQPLLLSAKRDYLSAAAVLYGAIYPDDWKSHSLRPEPIDKILEQVSCPVVGVFGELDNLVPVPNVARMCNILAEARKSFDVCVYPDCPHGFLNDTMPGRYRTAQAQVAWHQITSFLKSVFNGEWSKERAIWRFSSDTSVHYDFTKNKRWE